ncbi:YdeI/OmpD-associated family protein [Galbibacter sp. EGI 63066]|uniref:YdeI/OmpD-associated family protein n=1 Tax=Galbibacter sp. EGI 63066 TaxID=2993559 RepID=UPI0022489127|nr:YdeI/OmpD-associated family protein [Galbibacter sp. EGI 63066]MCX2679250.1 YdeI/OmpD-associated family protein [Galbibacter sp. EGI 63066]
MKTPELYFPSDIEWREWLHENHEKCDSVYLIFYTVDSDKKSMRWEEAVKVALCYGWIDSTVRKINHEKRKQYFTPRKSKSMWSKLNKNYIEELHEKGLIHDSGYAKIDIAKKNGSWTALDNVENLIVPEDLQSAFDTNKTAFKNYFSFSKTYKKGYLYWLNQAKRDATRKKRIDEIIQLCEQNIKSRN